MGDQWELYNQDYIGGTNEKGTNEMGDHWDGGPMSRGGGTNEMGDQWNGWCMGAIWGTNEMGDWWVGGPMRWGTNEMGDQWDGGPLGLADDGVTSEKRDQWDGGPMIWGTNEMGDQWAPIMYWGTIELGDQWEGDQWDGGPMRWGTSERIPSNCALTCSNKVIIGALKHDKPTPLSRQRRLVGLLTNHHYPYFSYSALPNTNVAINRP